MKIIGYILSIIGLIGLAAAMVPQINTFLIAKAQFTFLSQIANLYLTIGSLILVAIGLFILMKFGSRRSKKIVEVPIYQGKNIVGYRRQ